MLCVFCHHSFFLKSREQPRVPSHSGSRFLTKVTQVPCDLAPAPPPTCLVPLSLSTATCSSVASTATLASLFLGHWALPASRPRLLLAPLPSRHFPRHLEVWLSGRHSNLPSQRDPPPRSLPGVARSHAPGCALFAPSLLPPRLHYQQWLHLTVLRLPCPRELSSMVGSAFRVFILSPQHKRAAHIGGTPTINTG